jgi:hypothetical protein
MENVKLYDIRRVTKNDKNFIGMLINVEDINTMKFIGIDGDIHKIYSNEYTATTVRLEPKIREQFEKIKSEYQIKYKLEKEITELQKKLNRANSRIEKQSEKIATISGSISRKEFNKRIEVLFNKYKNKIDNSCEYIHVSNWENNCINVYFITYIERKTDENKYSFLYREFGSYDGELFVKEDEQYNSLVAEYFNQRANINKKLKNGEITTEGRIEVEVNDNNETLVYSHCIRIDFKERNEATIKEIEKIISRF